MYTTGTLVGCDGFGISIVGMPTQPLSPRVTYTVAVRTMWPVTRPRNATARSRVRRQREHWAVGAKACESPGGRFHTLGGTINVNASGTSATRAPVPRSRAIARLTAVSGVMPMPRSELGKIRDDVELMCGKLLGGVTN